MAERRITELWLIRHAPVLSDGALCGRRDLPADCSDTGGFAALRRLVPEGVRRLRSPARRCVQTSETLFPGGWQEAPALWEQDFGAWEGVAHVALPDLGPLPRTELARHRPPEGESFADLCDRVQPVLAALEEDTLVVAHAGTIRAALALALGAIPPALGFEIAPLSLTRIALLPDGSGLIRQVNACPR